MSKPICRHCVAEVQLFKQCLNLSAGTTLQGCSCLSGVETYLPALCFRGVAYSVVLKPFCQHCVAEVQLFKWCCNLSPGHCAAGVQLFKQCRNLSASILLQGCSCLIGVETYLPTLCSSCLSGVQTYLPGLCCRGAAV